MEALAEVVDVADAGHALVGKLVESGDAEIRRAISGVEISNEEILSVSQGLRDRGVGLQTITFLGYPGETSESALRSLDLNIELRPDHAFAILVRLPRGAQQPTNLQRLQLLFHLVSRQPALRGIVERALRSGNTAVLEHLFQFHHDASFLRSGELAAKDILGIALRMRRHRNKPETRR